MKKIYILLWAGTALSVAHAQDFTSIGEKAGFSHVKNTNGLAVADYDRDGDLDVFFTGIKNFNPAQPDTWSRLLRNKGDGTFEDVTKTAGFGIQYVNEGLKAERGEKMGASWGDYDNDGYPDLFLANSRENQLYHNNGDGTFTDVSARAGVAGCNVCYSASGLWWDHDRDGDLDLYVSNLNADNVMYENKGDGAFEDVTARLNLAGNNTITWASVAIDAGNDGFLDLLNVNDTQIKEFFENRSGQSYNEASRAYRLDNTGAGMGVAISDCNNDGFFDIYITNIYEHLPNPLFIDTGKRKYVDKAKEMGVDNTGWGWGTQFLDYDHDGDEDLAAVNGPIDKLKGAVLKDIPNFFFKNKLVEEGVARFEDWSRASGTDGIAKGKGLEVFDFDADGDLDMLVANMEQEPYFFKNETMERGEKSRNNWLQISLEGVRSNRNAFGAKVQIKTGARVYRRYHHGAAIFGQSVKPVHFGVGAAQIVDEIRVTWLSGLTEAIYKVPVNQILHFKEGEGIRVEPEPAEPDTVAGGAVVERYESRPNPFSAATTLTFTMAQAGVLDLTIYNASGQLAYRASDALATPGSLTFEWLAAGQNAGFYYYTARFNDKIIRGKLMKQ